jgi:hypothetical protein
MTMGVETGTVSSTFCIKYSHVSIGKAIKIYQLRKHQSSLPLGFKAFPLFHCLPLVSCTAWRTIVMVLRRQANTY